MDALLNLIKKEVETMDDTKQDLDYIKDLWCVVNKSLRDELSKGDCLDIASSFIDTLINKVNKLENEIKERDSKIDRLNEENIKLKLEEPIELK